MVYLTKAEQLLCLSMLENPLLRKSQKVFKSSAFYRSICKLNKLDLIHVKKIGRICEYSLSDTGLILFSLMAYFKGNENYRKYALNGEITFIF